MIKQFDPKNHIFRLELPSDRLERSESGNVAAKRILAQQGLQGENLCRIGRYEVRDAIIQNGNIFSANVKNIPITSKGNIVKLTLDEVEQMLLKNEITVASSIIALYRVLESRYLTN